MSVEQSSGLQEWYAALEASRSPGAIARRGRHARSAPALDTTVTTTAASTPLPGVGPDPLGHVRAGDPDPDPSWQNAAVSLCQALSPTVYPVDAEHTMRYACTRFPHPRQWQHIACDAVAGVLEVWHDGDVSTVDTTVMAIATDLVTSHEEEGQADAWPAVDGDVADLSPADRVRHGQLTGEQHERLAVVLEIWNALRELGTHVPAPLGDALTDAEAALSLRAGA